MFQLVGGLLAFFALFSAFAGVPVAKPARRGRSVKHVDRWGNAYEVPLSR